jgi:hypothetical protein
MKKKCSFLMNLFLLFLVASSSSCKAMQKIPKIANKYDPNQSAWLDSIDPTFGVINSTFIVDGNFSGAISYLKVNFRQKRVILTTDRPSIIRFIPKEPDGYNQISVVIGKNSIVLANLKFRYNQSQSIKIICRKLETNNMDG